MVRVLLGSWVAATGLSACGAAQIDIPPSIAAQARDCYQLILKSKPAQPPTMASPITLEDGTLLVQWRVSDLVYGSCQVDSTGSVLMLTQAELPESSPTDASAASNDTAAPAASTPQ